MKARLFGYIFRSSGILEKNNIDSIEIKDFFVKTRFYGVQIILGLSQLFRLQGVTRATARGFLVDHCQGVGLGLHYSSSHAIFSNHHPSYPPAVVSFSCQP